MRHSELAQVLRAANPWWSRRTRVSWAVDDVHLAQRARHEWLTGTLAGRAALSDVAHTPAGTATVLVGPRGVGKTTAAKDAVVQALADAGVRLSLGSDQNAVVDLIGEARALESGDMEWFEVIPDLTGTDKERAAAEAVAMDANGLLNALIGDPK